MSVQRIVALFPVMHRPHCALEAVLVRLPKGPFEGVCKPLFFGFISDLAETAEHALERLLPDDVGPEAFEALMALKPSFIELPTYHAPDTHCESFAVRVEPTLVDTVQLRVGTLYFHPVSGKTRPRTEDDRNGIPKDIPPEEWRTVLCAEYLHGLDHAFKNVAAMERK